MAAILRARRARPIRIRPLPRSRKGNPEPAVPVPRSAVPRHTVVAVEVSVGDRGVVVAVVTDDDTALALGSGALPVLGTPRLLAWCEAATCRALEGALPSPGRRASAPRCGWSTSPRARWGSRSPWSPWWCPSTGGGSGSRSRRRMPAGPWSGAAPSSAWSSTTSASSRGWRAAPGPAVARFLSRPGGRACAPAACTSAAAAPPRRPGATRRARRRAPSGRAGRPTGTLRCSTNPVTSKPRLSRAVRISPMPWFQDSWRVLTNSWSFST